MKKKLGLILCFTVALSLSVGFTNPSDSNTAEAVSQATTSKAAVPASYTDNGSVTTVISAEEQNMVENSSALSGFVPQENGQGFYFIKEK